MGTPTVEDVTSMNPKYKNKNFPELVPMPLENSFPPGTPAVALDFIKHLLVYDPKKRPGALDALAHPFFSELRTSRVDLPGAQGLVPLDMYNFTQTEYNFGARVIESTSLLPDWLPNNWMSNIDRYARAIHASKKTHKKTLAS